MVFILSFFVLPLTGKMPFLMFLMFSLALLLGPDALLNRRVEARQHEMQVQLPDILETVDENLRNRGMGFHSEMVPFTGRTFRVLRRIEKLVNEKTGKMIVMKNDAVILEGATCQSRYINNCRRFCPRAVYLYFREIWLERVEEQPARGTRDAAA